MAEPQAPNTVLPAQVPFLADLGVTLDGETLVLDLLPRHTNRRGDAHGGLIATLLDAALTRAARRALPAVQALATVEMKTSYLRPGRGQLRADGDCVHASGSLAFCEARLTDGAGQEVARASATLRQIRPVQT